MDQLYTWIDAARDLALKTSLTIDQAFAILSPLRATALQPDKSLAHLIQLFGSEDHEARGFALAALVLGGQGV